MGESEGEGCWNFRKWWGGGGGGGGEVTKMGGGLLLKWGEGGLTHLRTINF